MEPKVATGTSGYDCNEVNKPAEVRAAVWFAVIAWFWVVVNAANCAVLKETSSTVEIAAN